MECGRKDTRMKNHQSSERTAGKGHNLQPRQVRCAWMATADTLGGRGDSDALLLERKIHFLPKILTGKKCWPDVDTSPVIARHPINENLFVDCGGSNTRAKDLPTNGAYYLNFNGKEVSERFS